MQCCNAKRSTSEEAHGRAFQWWIENARTEVEACWMDMCKLHLMHDRQPLDIRDLEDLHRIPTNLAVDILTQARHAPGGGAAALVSRELQKAMRSMHLCSWRCGMQCCNAKRSTHGRAFQWWIESGGYEAMDKQREHEDGQRTREEHEDGQRTSEDSVTKQHERSDGRNKKRCQKAKSIPRRKAKAVVVFRRQCS